MTQLPGYPCTTCCRQSRGITATIDRGYFQFCSRECLTLFLKHDTLSHDEKKAAIKGGDLGGQYLDHIGKTDLADLSADEWAEFCGRIFQGACGALKAQADDEIPF